MFLINWMKSRRLQLFVSTVIFFTILMSILRLIFYVGFSGIENTVKPPFSDVLYAFYLGAKFDLRLAIILCMPLVLLSVIPKLNLFKIDLIKKISLLYFAVISVLLFIFYVFDFGHYSYLGLRINSSVLRFATDKNDSLNMLWQSYHVVWITLGVILTSVASFIVIKKLHTFFTSLEAVKISIPSSIFGCICMIVLVFLGLLGRYSNINIHNPVPLRWNAFSFTDNHALSSTGINPVVFFVQTFKFKEESYNDDEVEKYYDVIAEYLSVKEPNKETYTLDRLIKQQPHKLQFEKTPNIIFIMLESLGASRVSAYGLPFESTPHLDELAENGLMFENFYVPVSGTARTVWASITGIPDIFTQETATRNPHLTRQRLVLNHFTDHDKYYFIGGNSSWANMNALIRNSIKGITFSEEKDWKSPIVDVWGISDLNLFQESHEIIKNFSKDKPFIAYIQTAGNHRPFTIPKESGDFKTKELPLEQLTKNGFRSNEQFNAVRLIDYSVGEFFKLAKQEPYFENTIFVLYGDHNNRITQTPHMKSFYEILDLDGLHVPHIIYAPKLIKPQKIKVATSLVDVVPTLAGLLGVEYLNTTMGRDVFMSAPEGERMVYTQDANHINPTIGMVGENYMLRMKADGSEIKLHKLDTPTLDVSEQEPEKFEYLKKLTRGMYELSLFQMYNNRENN